MPTAAQGAQTGLGTIQRRKQPAGDIPSRWQKNVTDSLPESLIGGQWLQRADRRSAFSFERTGVRNRDTLALWPGLERIRRWAEAYEAPTVGL